MGRVRHNLPMPKQTSAQRWRCPAVLRVKSFLAAALGTAIALVFFPLWFAVPVAVAAGAWGLGVAVLGSSVTVDEEAGTLRLRMGLLLRQVRLFDVTAVLVDEAKVSIGRANGGEVSVYAWRKDRLDALLGVPAVAGDIGHAISRAAALARANREAGAQPVPAGAAMPAGAAVSGAAAAAGQASGAPAAAGVPAGDGSTPASARPAGGRSTPPGPGPGWRRHCWPGPGCSRSSGHCWCGCTGTARC